MDSATKDFLLSLFENHNSLLLESHRGVQFIQNANNSPRICRRATGWNGPFELAASTTILLPVLLHVNIYASAGKAVYSLRQETSLHFSLKKKKKLKLSAAGGNWLVSDVSREGEADWLTSPT